MRELRSASPEILYGAHMKIPLDAILRVLDANDIPYSMEGMAIAVEHTAAIDLQVENSLCYFVGDDPDPIVGIKSSIIICKPGLRLKDRGGNAYIYTEYPQLAFYYASSLFAEKPEPRIDPHAIVDNNARLGQRVSIGAFCVIEECTIGNDVSVESGVRIHKGTIVGDNVRILSNTVIGAEGVAWVQDGRKNTKVPCAQTGIVIIEENVFLGSNLTIARGAFFNKPTVIGNGSMISHGTMIGHGVVVGARNHFANNVAIAGSVSTGENCFFGSGAVVRPHIKIPNNTIIGAGAVVVNDFEQEGLVLAGNPARPIPKKQEGVSGVPAPF